MTLPPRGLESDDASAPFDTTLVPSPLRASSARLEAIGPSGGELRMGPYVLKGELGRGGMGMVFRARDPAAARDVALKTLVRFDGDALERFRREAHALAALDHPGIVKVHAADQADGRPYLVCELIEGARALNVASKGLPLEERVHLVRDACRAIGHAHARGIVHRDIKPANLLVGDDGRVRVTDFGLALLDDRERLTATGTLLGTPQTMAPEQLLGTREVGAPADVWGLGVALYETLTGELPFIAATLSEQCVRVAAGNPVPPSTLAPGVTPGVEAVCLRALTPEIEGRWPDANAMADALDAALRGEHIAMPRTRRRVARWLVAGLAPVPIVLAAVVAWPTPKTLEPATVTTTTVPPVAAPTRNELLAPALRTEGLEHESLAAWTIVPTEVDRLEVVVAVTPGLGRGELHVEWATTEEVTVAPELRAQPMRPLEPGVSRYTVPLEIGWNVITLRPVGGGRPLDRRDVVRLPRALDLVGGTEVRCRVDGSSMRLVTPGPPAERPKVEGTWNVAVLAPFFLGTYEVSRGQFRAYCAATGARDTTKDGADDLPVAALGERELIGYCEWAGLRLPTDTEWNHAAVDMTDGNCAGQPFTGACAVTDTSIMGARSRWGQWHMIGNVNERVQFIGINAEGILSAARVSGAFGAYFGSPLADGLDKLPRFLHWNERHDQDGLRVARGVGEGRGAYYKVRTD